VGRIRSIRIGNRIVPIPHPFVEEVEWLIRTNHRLLLDSISRIEQEQISEASKNEDPAEAGSEIDFAISEATELREAATNMALVGLVTRFQHAVNVLVDDYAEMQKRAADIDLRSNLRTLNRRFGKGPTENVFFADLATVRDSIIHADSNVEWMHGVKRRMVPKKYRDASLERLKLAKAQRRELKANSTPQLKFTETHLQEAMKKCTDQINWYDEQAKENLSILRLS
jgi:hypothetical protein